MEREDRATSHVQKKSEKHCVSLVPIFNHLEAEQMNDVMQVVQTIPFKQGEMLFHAGEASESLFIVNKGQVKIYRLSEAGKEHIVRVLNPGDFTGELALFRETIQENYAESL